MFNKFAKMNPLFQKGLLTRLRIETFKSDNKNRIFWRERLVLGWGTTDNTRNIHSDDILTRDALWSFSITKNFVPLQLYAKRPLMKTEDAFSAGIKSAISNCVSRWSVDRLADRTFSFLWEKKRTDTQDVPIRAIHTTGISLKKHPKMSQNALNTTKKHANHKNNCHLKNETNLPARTIPLFETVQKRRND